MMIYEKDGKRFCYVIETLFRYLNCKNFHIMPVVKEIENIVVLDDNDDDLEIDKKTGTLENTYGEYEIVPKEQFFTLKKSRTRRKIKEKRLELARLTLEIKQLEELLDRIQKDEIEVSGVYNARS